MKTIKIDEIILRKIALKDAKEMYQYAKNPLIGKMAGWTAHQSIEETKSVIKTLMKLNTYALVYQDVMVGTIGIDIVGNKAILGYALSEDYWYKNIMHRALKALIIYLFNKTKISLLEATTYQSNYRSQNVLLKLGFQKISQVKKIILQEEIILDLFLLEREAYERMILPWQ